MKWVSQHTNASIVETDFFETCSTSYANSTALWIILRGCTYEQSK